jgi:hypothetical protein
MSSQKLYPVCAFGFNIGEQVEIDGNQCRISHQNTDGTVTFVTYRRGCHIRLTKDEFMTKLGSGAIVITPPKSGSSASGKSHFSEMLSKTASGIPHFAIANYRANFVKVILAVPRGQRARQLIDGLLAETHRECLEKWQNPEWLVKTKPPARSTAYRWLKAADNHVNMRPIVPAFVRSSQARG